MAAISPQRSHLDPDKEDQKMAAHRSNGGAAGLHDVHNADGSSLVGSDILGLEALDPALNMKMHLVNDVSCFLRLLAAQGRQTGSFPNEKRRRHCERTQRVPSPVDALLASRVSVLCCVPSC